MRTEAVMERVKREFLFFELDMMRTSRENIFANACEIEVKRQASRDICRRAEEGKIGAVEEAMLEGVHNILDAVYCYYENERADGSDAPVHGAYMRWMASIGAGAA